MSKHFRIILDSLLAVFRNPVKFWRKITSSKPKRVSNGGPIWLYREQVLDILFSNILGSIGSIRVNSFNRLVNSG